MVPVERDEMIRKIKEDEDFIHSPKHQNSLNKLLAKTDNILENGAIGRLLLIPETEVEELYQKSIAELRKEMVDGEDAD